MVVRRGGSYSPPTLSLQLGPNSNRMHVHCKCTFSAEKSASGFRILPQIFKIFKDDVNGFPPSRISALGHCNDAKERHSPISSGHDSANIKRDSVKILFTFLAQFPSVPDSIKVMNLSL